MRTLRSVVGDDARASWLLLGAFPVAIAENLLAGDPVWTGFLVATLAVLVLPVAVFRDLSTMLPPEVTALAVLPAVTRTLGPAWATDYVVYVGVAAVALAVVVELTLFTDAEMAPWFADAMVVATTMAAIGVWVVVQFYADRFLGTDLVGSLEAVNWEFVRATVAGVAAAVVFELYFEYGTPSRTNASDLPGSESG